ncbi:repressor LexA [Paenibacillus sp. VTT E-133280]|uniref:LexA repressor n=3 Tax=Paenibacillus TaxID=44249 RepID=A0A1R0Y2X9_9BACL|nr:MULTISPECIES: transcriptional repressor LexA [Paenibacillus]MBY3622012.1 transcriptional repressor LexA [Acinetobacter sp. CUI P1]AIQ24366.1 XRE family transcriptional regulator [Paenibacillus sp. FSL H7-0737]KAA1180790.1 transcriptional repressor LexA [Paenibacillus sp. B2(2019)]KTD86459.1 XRE family transcriptional regulator [Paenibacillus etheri]OMD41705.1 repressor LexA [Paenibacillus odorifer]
MSKISSRQLAILEFIRSEVRSKGYPPSVREIGEAVGLASSSTVHGHLDRLEKKGLIRRDPTKPRAIELLGQEDSENVHHFAQTVARIPVVGKVTAGVPITATENIEDYFPLPTHYVGDNKVFMLSVQGDSMVEAGIMNGDYVIVRQQQTADNGDIVVAMTEEDEATVKTFYKERDHIRLQPENPAYEPLRLNRVTILGRVIGLFRDIH